MSGSQAKSRIVCFGEVMVRLSAPDNELLLQSPRLDVRFGGAEANVAVSLARFGHDAAMATILPDNALGRAALEEMRKHGVDTGLVAFDEGRMGLYFVTPGAVVRPSEVLYDRAHSAFAEASADRLDWAALLAGADWLHLSGVTPALGTQAAQAAQRAVVEARRFGVKVSFDGNYRAKLWARSKDDARAVLGTLLSNAEIAFVNERDIALVLGESFENADALARPRAAARAAFAAFPNLARIASTARVQHHVDSHELSAFMFARDAAVQVQPIPLAVIVDRIGGGDAFAAGVLHGVITGMSDRGALEFGLAASALKHAIPGDFNLSSVADVRDLLENGALDVRR